MSLVGTWVKATDGRWYCEPWIGVHGEWAIYIEGDDDPDWLVIRAHPRAKGEPRATAKPVHDPQAIID